MTIDEAIKHAEEVASRKFDDRVHCIKCAEEHRQLAEWLKDYKRLLEQQPCDAISREAVYSILNEHHIDEDRIKSDMDERQNLTVNSIASDVSLLPSVTQKYGKWIRIDKYKCKCDQCEVISCIAMYPNGDANYCPNCGSRMVEPQESE